MKTEMMSVDELKMVNGGFKPVAPGNDGPVMQDDNPGMGMYPEGRSPRTETVNDRPTIFGVNLFDGYMK